MAERDINLLNNSIRHVPGLLIQRFELVYPEFVMKTICTLRWVAESQAAFAKGRDATGKIINPGEVITYCDGIIHRSQHNPDPLTGLSNAFDVGIFDRMKNRYIDSFLKKADADRYYIAAGKMVWDIPEIFWGGMFKHPKEDLPHYEKNRMMNK